MVSTLDHIYNLVLFLVTYIVPMSAMVCCYSAMGRELWGSRSIGELTQRQLDSIKSKRKVVRMLLLIVLVFGLCWLPYHAYFICTYHWPALVYSKYIQHVYLAFYWLAMSNAMLNPLIYYCMNQRFREYFRQAVCEWRCRVWSRESLTHQTDGGETPPIRRFSHSYSRSAGGTLEDGSESGVRSRKREENGRTVQFAAGYALPLHHYSALQQIWSAHQLTNIFTAPAGCHALYKHTDC